MAYVYGLFGIPGGNVKALVAPARERDTDTFWALLRTDRVVLDNFIVGAGTLVAGALGVAFQSIVSHTLRPTDFGSVFAVMSVITLIGLPATAFTLLMAREASRSRATGRWASSRALLWQCNQTLLILGAAIGIAMFVLAGPIGELIGAPIAMLLAAAAGIPFALALPVLLGEFQGEQRFVAYAALAVGQAALKLAGAVLVGAIIGPVGVIVGVSGAAALIYAIGLLLLRQELRARPRLSWWRQSSPYLMIVVPSTLALAALLNTDILFVKHFFPSSDAGRYAAVAALGRAIFWASSGVATVLFPKVVFRGAKGLGTSRLVGLSLALVAVGGLIGIVLLASGSRWLLTLFAGAAYADAATYVLGYSIGMILLGCAAVLIASLQSRGRPQFLAVLIPLAAVEPVLLTMFHDSLWQVVKAVDVSMGLVVVGLSAVYLAQSRAPAVRPATIDSRTN